ncbi:MAG: sensor histidine kinase [Coleofasciculaceae cyanobacterium RL_1_1]|nr:sensor histidine kinase [Coleofasciculaceae cyanobacterium RL_1_1]
MSVERTVSSLCKMQASLLVQNLGAVCCMVYVTERSLTGSGDRLISVAIEPESVIWDQERVEKREAVTKPGSSLDSVPSNSAKTTIDVSGSFFSESGRPRLFPLQPNVDSQAVPVRGHLVSAPMRLSAQERETFPLSHKDEIVGVLALYRSSIAWNSQEQRCIETVVTTIECAIAMHIQNLALRESLENTYINDLDRQSHLSDLFHQVRNPLAALHVFGKLLDRRLVGNPAALEIVENIIRESDRLKSLLDDLSIVAKHPSLELAALRGEIEDLKDLNEDEPVVNTGDEIDEIGKVEAIKTVPSTPRSRVLSLLPASASESLTEISISDLLRPILRVAETMAEVHNLTFISHIHCPQIMIRTDIKLMTEALQNLIDNALKYTPECGRVRVAATQIEADHSFVEICIRDTGLGIPPEDLDHIFQRGYRGEKSQMDIQGTGLGLQIVQQIVKQLGAEIAIESEGRGKGVEVRLLLPVSE